MQEPLLDSPGGASGKKRSWSWGLLLSLLLSLPLLVGVVYFPDCSGVSSLTSFLIVSGGLHLLRTSVAFYWGVPLDYRQMDGRRREAAVVRALGRIAIVCSIWGVFLTVNKSRNRFPGGGSDCNGVVFSCAFLVSTATIGVVVVIVTYLSLRFVYNHCCSKTKNLKHKSIRFVYESYYSSASDEDDSDSESSGSDSSNSVMS